MRTVASLIKELQKFPPQAGCNAYEGEGVGITIYLGDECGWIECTGKDENEDHIPADLFDNLKDGRKG